MNKLVIQNIIVYFVTLKNLFLLLCFFSINAKAYKWSTFIQKSINGIVGEKNNLYL